ncbi:MAG TPA: MFS transporter [Candidatus Sulfotelmatobacter sp.]|nr:MFS transporter [Candidatus Sulfotelmatobacter sp.]
MAAAAPNPAAGKYPIAAAALGLMLAGTFMPSPLYELYRREWGLTPGDISLVFAIYAASLIPSLLFLGGVSDTFGRRKTLLVALGIHACGSLVFAFATGLWWLIAARILQGLAMGIGTGTATAAIREWMDEPMRPRAGAVALIGLTVGSSLGALLGGFLGQYAPYPTTLPYLVHIVLLAACAAAVATVPSCPHLQPAAHHGLPAIDPTIRRPFFLVSTVAFVGWSALAIFASLVPTFLIKSLDLHSLLVGAFVVTGTQTGSFCAQFVGRAVSNRAALLLALVALGVGIWMLLLGVPTHLYVLVASATLVVGLGNGLGYLAGLNVVNAIAPAAHRAEVISAYFVAGYLGFSIPALLVGIAANVVGLYASITGAAVVLGLIAIVAMVVTQDRNLQAAPAKT